MQIPQKRFENRNLKRVGKQNCPRHGGPAREKWLHGKERKSEVMSSKFERVGMGGGSDERCNREANEPK